MLLLTTIFLLLSNAVNLQRDVSILNSQIAIFAIIYSMWSIYNQFYYLFMATGIAVFNGLFFINLYTMLFSQFLLILCFSILFLTAFKHVKINVATVKKSYFELSDQSKTEFNSFYENTIKYIYHIRKHKLDPIYPNYLQDPKLDIPSEDFLIPVTSLTFSENDENGKKRLPWEHLDAELSYTSRSLTEERPDTKNFENVNNNEMYTITEYPLIILFIIIGSIFLMSSADLLSVFLSVELQSYGLYLLSSSFRNSETATGGGLTYFLLGGLSSTFILLGASFIYANCGNTLLENLYIISDLSQQNIINNNLSNKLTQRAEGLVNYGMEERYDLWYNSYYLHLSLVMAGVGFLFKISAAPFHFWSPDVYDAIPTVVTTFVAIIAKISIFIFLLDLVYYTSKTLQTINFNWTIILLVSCLLSLVIGSVLGLTQERIKRLYAYSTISHIGFILLALAICSVESIQSYFFYIMQYSLSNLNAFLLLLVIGYTIRPYLDEKKVDKLKNTKITELSDKNSKLMHMIEGTSPLGDEKAQNTNQLSETQKLDQLPDKANSPIQLVSQLKGYSAINPMLALSLIITLFSFIGVPPLLGFFAKQMVLSAALDKGYIFIALVAILTSVISAVYYLSVVKNIYFDEVDESKWKFSKDKFSFKIPFKGSSEALTLDKTEPFYLRNRIAINWNILFIVRQKAREFTARLYSFETHSVEYKNQPIGPLNIIISSLSILILLFMFTPVEWLNLSSILSLSLFYF